MHREVYLTDRQGSWHDLKGKEEYRIAVDFDMYADNVSAGGIWG